MKIKDISKENRPRERFLKHGPEALSTAELFAIILRTGSKEENVIEMSNRLISEYGLDKLFECTLKELQKIKGIGPSKAMQILAISELGKRYNQLKRLNEKNQKRITCAKDVFNLFHERLKDEKQEYFYVLMLNNMNYIVEEKLISKGILDKTLIHPREIFRYAIKNAVSKIILVHNHPDGDPTPSSNDIEITEELAKAGDILGIKLIDHVIIGRNEKWSWKEG
ncbi:JAB domain-containing protein [Candidatus Bathyarchaeota archaeon]|nr:MAG: JAB domain-containing protein [Candidatus Bathyarchaeota archaeon]